MRGPQTGLRRKAPVTGPNAPALRRKAPALGRKAPFTGRSTSGTKALFVLLQCVVQIRGKNHSPSTHLSSLSFFGQGFTLSKPLSPGPPTLSGRNHVISKHNYIIPKQKHVIAKQKQSTPTRNVLLPDKDMLSPNRSMLSPNRNMSFPIRNMLLPNRIILFPNRNMSFPKRNMFSNRNIFPNTHRNRNGLVSLGLPHQMHTQYAADILFFCPNERSNHGVCA